MKHAISLIKNLLKIAGNNFKFYLCCFRYAITQLRLYIRRKMYVKGCCRAAIMLVLLCCELRACGAAAAAVAAAAPSRRLNPQMTMFPRRQSNFTPVDVLA